MIELKKVMLPNGEELGYRTGGGAKGTEKTLLLIHGNLVSSRHWGKLLEVLEETYKVVAVDLRGSGISTYNSPISSFKDFARDIKLFCDILNLKDFLLIGWSMGGGISQQFVIDYPGYAQRLILFESVPTTGYPYHKKDGNGEFLTDFYDNKADLLEDKIQLKPMIDALEKNDRAFMKYLWDQLVFSLEKPDGAEYSILVEDIYMTRNLRDAAWAAHSFNISNSFNGVSLGTGEVSKIELPVLVFAGDSDLIVPLNLSEFTSKDIGTNAKLEILENCGHAPHYDDLDAVVTKIKDFYKP